MSIIKDPAIRIRRYQKKDWEQVCDLIQRTIVTYLSHDQPKAVTKKMLDTFSSHNSDLHMKWGESSVCALVAEDHGRIVGVIRGKVHIRIQQLYVDGAYQRQGIGKKLVLAFAQAARRDGCTYIKVRSTRSAVGFYETLGFKKTTGLRSSAKDRVRYQSMKLFLS